MLRGVTVKASVFFHAVAGPYVPFPDCSSGVFPIAYRVCEASSGVSFAFCVPRIVVLFECYVPRYLGASFNVAWKDSEFIFAVFRVRNFAGRHC